MVKLFQPLRERNFRLLWVGETVSLLGDHFYFVALPFLILDLTGSDLAVGTVLMTAAFPRAILMLVGGAVTDRYTPRNVMLASNICRGLLVVLLTALVLTDVIVMWQLYAVALAFGVADAFFFPAYTSIVPRVVADPSQLAPANGLLQTSANTTVMVGPAIGGIVVAAVGSAAALGFDAVTFALSALMLSLLRIGSPGEGSPATRGGVGEAIREGLGYVWRDRHIRALLLTVAVVNFATQGPLLVGLATLADERYGGPVAFGAMISALGAGALAGSLLGGSIGSKLARGPALLTVWFISSVCIATIGVVHSLVTAAAFAAAMGIGGGVVNVMLLSWLQARTDPSLIGRVMSVVMFAALGLTPLSLGLAGLVAESHVTALFLGSGALVFTTTAVALGSGALRDL